MQPRALHEYQATDQPGRRAPDLDRIGLGRRGFQHSSGPLSRDRGGPTLRVRNLLRDAMEALPLPVIVLDGHQRIRYANVAARALGPGILSVRELRRMRFARWARRVGLASDRVALSRLVNALRGAPPGAIALGDGAELRVAALRGGAPLGGHVVVVLSPRDARIPGSAEREEEVTHELRRAREALGVADRALQSLGVSVRGRTSGRGHPLAARPDEL